MGIYWLTHYNKQTYIFLCRPREGPVSRPGRGGLPFLPSSHLPGSQWMWGWGCFMSLRCPALGEQEAPADLWLTSDRLWVKDPLIQSHSYLELLRLVSNISQVFPCSSCSRKGWIERFSSSDRTKPPSARGMVPLTQCYIFKHGISNEIGNTFGQEVESGLFCPEHS